MDAAKGAIGKARTHGGWLGPWWDWDAGNFGELKNGAKSLIQLGGKLTSLLREVSGVFFWRSVLFAFIYYP